MWNDLILYPRDKKNKYPTPRQTNSGGNKVDYKLNGCQDPLGSCGTDTIKLAVAEGTVVTTGNGGVAAVAVGVDADGFVTGEWTV